MIPDASSRHTAERVRDQCQSRRITCAHMPLEEETQRDRLWKLGRAAEASVHGIARPLETPASSVQKRSPRGIRPVERGGALVGLIDAAPQHREQLGARLGDLVPPAGIGVAYAAQYLPERGHAVARLRREVGPAEERDALRREEHRQRPPSLSDHGLDRPHVDRIQIGALFPVHLDVDEPFVHEGCRGLVLEGLALHDVTPVAGRVPDGQQNG